MKSKQRRTASRVSDIAELKANVDSLIRENTRLKRQLTKLQEGKGKPGVLSLTRINNRVKKALTETSKAIRGRGKSPTARKRITDPVLLEKRRAALAKARAARAAKQVAAP